MRLDLLLEREPFKGTFSRTVSSYLLYRFDWQGVIQWRNVIDHNNDSLLVNSKLNLIYPDALKTATLRDLAAEYAYHPNPVRRLLQWLYVRYTVSMPLRKHLSGYFVTIDPLPEECRNWCFLPGNNSIRIIDFNNDECVVLRKDGFNQQYLSELISLREEYPELPGPKLLHSDLGAGWYAEERIHGLPINRLNDDRVIQVAMSGAQHSMFRLYEKTSTEISVSEWFAEQKRKMSVSVHNLPKVYSDSIREEITSIVDCLLLVCTKYIQSNTVIDIVQTHGDFQPANILTPSDPNLSPVYLIDWEYTGRRCRWYDALVFELHTRSPAGLARRITEWLSDEHSAFKSIEWCGLERSLFPPQFVMASFLLDDMLLRMADTTIPGLLKPNKGFLMFLDELSRIQLVLST